MKIDQKALEQTKQICHQELDKIQKQYNLLTYQVIFHYLCKELFVISLFAIVGLMIVLFISRIQKEINMSFMIIYFMFLGVLAIYENLKNRIYHIEELIHTCYINEGRSFFIKTLGISILHIIIFFICQSITLASKQVIELIIYTFIPFYMSQLVVLFLIDYIYNSFILLSIYGLLYLTIGYVSYFLHLSRIVTMTMGYAICIIGLIIYMISIAYLYKKKQGVDMKWN